MFVLMYILFFIIAPFVFLFYFFCFNVTAQKCCNVIASHLFLALEYILVVSSSMIILFQCFNFHIGCSQQFSSIKTIELLFHFNHNPISIHCSHLVAIYFDSFHFKCTSPDYFLLQMLVENVEMRFFLLLRVLTTTNLLLFFFNCWCGARACQERNCVLER